jgi:anti-sigma B factor antagonist
MIAPFEVATETIDEVDVFTVNGELDLDSAPRLEQPLNAAIASGSRAVLIDLSGCEFIDSTGLAILVGAWRTLEERNGDSTGSRLVLCCPDDQVERLFRLTGLGDAIPILPNRDSALAALG